METPASYYRDQLIAAGAHRLLSHQQMIAVVGYHGSCRISVDAQGELQRLFHARALTELKHREVADSRYTTGNNDSVHHSQVTEQPLSYQ